jgi:homoserine dehydrogenase
MKNVKIGLIGFGTIGSGVVKWIQQNGGLISARCGVQLELTRIADLDITTDRGVAVNPDVLTTNYEDLIKDPNLDVIVELVGGTTIARKIVLAALEAGKPVVTANKALLAHHGDELFAAAEKSASDIYYEASVGGGIPIIKALREGLAANHIQHIYGILNGTCNYILTRMEREGADFDEVLGDAQELGFAEADPAADIDGRDTAHKACILASLAYGEWFGMGPIFIEGIRNLDSQDIKNAAEAGYKIKLLGIIKLESGNIQMRVHPTLVPTASTLAEVSDEYNAIWVTGDVVGDTMYYGRGAGRDATASAVIADLIDVALNLKFDSSHRVAAFRPHRS